MFPVVVGSSSIKQIHSQVFAPGTATALKRKPSSKKCQSNVVIYHFIMYVKFMDHKVPKSLLEQG